jgi:hypothetical protein
MEGIILFLFFNQEIQDFKSISWTPQETYPRDWVLGINTSLQGVARTSTES